MLVQPAEHPFPTKHAIESSMMRIDPSICLEAVLADFHSYGFEAIDSSRPKHGNAG